MAQKPRPARSSRAGLNMFVSIHGKGWETAACMFLYDLVRLQTYITAALVYKVAENIYIVKQFMVV
jgi:hypothetical protein